MSDTIFALSSGAPPAAIAVIRISGSAAGDALSALGGELPAPGHARLRTLRDRHGEVLDRALVLWMPGPNSSTGEDVAELHLHGGRAVIAAVERALAWMDKLRRATPGEFTRRAFANGRIDLAEAEGLADLLSSETELQRRSAQALAGGALSRQVETWRGTLLDISASLEAVLDFSDEDDVSTLPGDFRARAGDLAAELQAWLDRPHAETLKEGFRVVLAGPPNAGKSTLFNALVEREVAITAELAGTTRDVLDRTVAIEGVPFQFFDTAGLHEGSGDVIEAIGMERARDVIDLADLVLWLGPEGEGPEGCWEIAAQCDQVAAEPAKTHPRHVLSAVTGQGLDALRRDLAAAAREAMPRSGEVALNARQRGLIANGVHALASAVEQFDPLLAAEELRLARLAFDSLLGRTTTEDMLDALFDRFCIGK